MYLRSDKCSIHLMILDSSGDLIYSSEASEAGTMEEADDLLTSDHLNDP